MWHALWKGGYLFKINNSVLAQKCEKHAKWRICDYCSFMWTNTLAISTSSPVPRSFSRTSVYSETGRNFHNAIKKINGDVTLNKTRKFPDCWPHPLATSIVTPFSTVGFKEIWRYYRLFKQLFSKLTDPIGPRITHFFHYGLFLERGWPRR